MANPVRSSMALGDFDPLTFATTNINNTISAYGSIDKIAWSNPASKLDTRKWSILDEHICDNGVTVIRIQYLDFKDEFDGKKILVFEDYETFYQIRNTGAIDPQPKTSPSPMAEFESSDNGMRIAINFAEKHESF